MPQYNIPFNRPSALGREYEYVEKAVTSGQIGGDGPYSKQAEALLEELLDVPRVLLTTSCTHALEMSALLLELQPGDEVIVPSFTFVSTANAYALRGAKIVFADIRPDTLNLDVSKLPNLITPQTKAIVLVHYAGVGCEMDAILHLARQHNISVVEDNAHGLFGKYKGQQLGTFGALATQSFHETKNFTCGEGGALLINDDSLIERAEIIREKGTNRSQFFRGQVDKYTWRDLGSSYVMSDLLAAFLLAQFEQHLQIQEARKRIWERYNRGLQPWAANFGIGTPRVPSHCEQAYHMYYILMPSLQSRQALITHLKSRGILSVFHYLPLHLSEMGRKLGGRVGDCPVTEDLSDRLLRLPFYRTLGVDEQETVIDALSEFTPDEAQGLDAFDSRNR